MAGISIGDLLSILSISKDAYKILIDGGDRKAIKSASMIQRSLMKADASMEEVEYCSRCKIKWDLWVRKNRHLLTGFDFNTITQQVKVLLTESIGDSQSVIIFSLNNTGIHIFLLE